MWLTKVTVYTETSRNCRKTIEVGAYCIGTGSITRVLRAADKSTPVIRTFLTPPAKSVKG